MATVVDGGVDTFNALLYGELHPNAQRFIEEQYHTPSTLLNEAGQRFYDYSNKMFANIVNSDPMRLARAARRAVGSIWENEDIRVLASIAEMQWASPTMQRWVMANPTVKRLYQQQRLEGYEGSYKDPFPDTVGEEDYNYRRVMNGVVEETEEGDWSATTYFDDLLPDDRELSLDEQVDIQLTWEEVIYMIRKGGDDPTSRFNASL